jgi:aspartyl-tRNA(Asn)/glutamyl-tRNA(Gln) amidotransferase subunit A
MGPLGWSVSDVALGLAAMAGFDPRDDSSSRRPVDACEPGDPSLAGVRIGLPENFYLENVDVQVGLAVRRAFQSAAALGAQVVDVRVPDIAALNTVGRVLLLVEAPAALSAHLHRREEFGGDVLALLDQGRQVSGVDYVNAQRLRRVLIAEFRRLFERIDCLFTPATPIPAPRIGQGTVSVGGVEEDTRLASTRFVRAVNVLGFPALSLPCGFTPAGLPAGLQIIGPPFSEARLLAIGAALEAAGGCRARAAPQAKPAPALG